LLLDERQISQLGCLVQLSLVRNKLLNKHMNKTALQDIQRTLNININLNQIDAVDSETKWAALELMHALSTSVEALAKKMVKPDMKLSLGKSLYPKPKSSNNQPSNRVLGV